MTHSILYIEDNEDNMMLVQRALEARGYHLLKAMGGLDGIAIAETEQVDLILLDINLPDIDGYEVARRLRASVKRDLATIPIIAITANALKGDAQKALDAGCDVYMSKPINIRELWARVEAFVPSRSDSNHMISSCPNFHH
jgi:two-component system cell cycle response regulator DivK